MILIKEMFKNLEDKFRITNLTTERQRDKLVYENSYPAHVHDTFIEFEIVHKGYMIQIINGTRYELPAGSIAVLRPADCHSIEWSPDAEIITVHFLPGVISKELLYSIMQYKENIVCTFSKDDTKNILNSSRQLFEEYEKSQPFYEKIIKNLIETICYSALRNLNSISVKERNLTPVQKAVMYLQTTFMNNPSLDEVAGYVHLNTSYFSRVFKEDKGITYSKYLTRLKLKYAEKLLCETNMTITDVCFNSGFGSLSNFSKYFKNQFKMSPNEMRKRYGKNRLKFYKETLCGYRRYRVSDKEKYLRWLEDKSVDEVTKKELANLSEKEIEDRFYCDLEFGTGGLRGVMAAGTNRMNVYTVRLATQGLANEISDLGEDAKNKGVVIAFDSRNNSKLFAAECAKVLCANGIKTYIFDDLRPTPELSFAVRHLGCVRGVVITASHNPKEYNGYKVYGEDGGQIEPETAKKIISYINDTDIFDDIKTSAENTATVIGADVDRAYLDSVKAQSTGVRIPEDYKVVYTPLHGSGNLLVRKILSEIGVKNVFTVPEQELPDGNFPTVKSPNPENAEAFTIAIEYAKKQNADIIFGTDPDSDRIGVVVKNSDGEYITLNGNQTGVLLCEYILRKAKECSALPENPVVVKTIVTTEMIKAITAKYNAEMIDVLTGFKFIGEQIKLLEEKGTPESFMFGLEESYGYLKGTYARDKDAVVASMLIAELAADCKAQGLTLYDKLIELYEEYGFYLESLETKTLKGIDGRKQINEIMNKFRTEKLPIEVLEIKDYTKGIDGLPKSDVLKYFLKDNAWFAVRPSGTEPKIKFYFGVCANSKEDASEEIEKLKKTVLDFAN